MFTLDSTRWTVTCQFMGNSLKAGFKCNECGTWKYASEFLVCDCDKQTQFVITGKEHGQPVWWNIDTGWTMDIDQASTFPVGIFGEKLPLGAEGILELTLTGEHVSFYSTLPGGGV